VALLLQKKGITRVRPLDGGIDAWLSNKFPLEAPASINQPADKVTALSQEIRLG
jgi:3-mercaptopyruvate sulfurtransferase SseA